ncbi:MAG: PilZ domain-containing protein [Treponema sp.]|jgi:hypothetical protein|nr:PilZ domain-containing protein [Treponema sp.]
MDSKQNFLGKKIFFLYPQIIVYNEVITDLFMQEYETYAANDHLALRRILRRFPDSIVFVNIDEKLSEAKTAWETWVESVMDDETTAWEVWIRGVMNDPATAQVSIGILSTANNDDIKRKYLTEIKITGGFIHVSTDVKKLISQITEVLKINNAQGRRKFIRFKVDDEKTTTVNIPVNEGFINGYIKDISAAGFSCTFQEDPLLEKNSLIHNIQIKLQSVLLRAEAIVFGSRMEGLVKIYLFMFTPQTDSNAPSKIRSYIRENIQARMDLEMKK